MQYNVDGKYEGGEWELDGNIFKNCVFTNAVLVYRGGPPPELEKCVFNNCRLSLRDAAERTEHFLRAMRAQGFSPMTPESQAK